MADRPGIRIGLRAGPNLNEKSHRFSDYRVKRRDRMILIGLPVDPDGSDSPNSRSHLIIHGGEAGLRLQTFNDRHLRKRINFKVSFPKGAELESFRVETEVVWRDVYFWEDWKGYQYALKFAESLSGHYLKLKRLFCRFPGMAETPPRVNHRRGPV